MYTKDLNALLPKQTVFHSVRVFLTVISPIYRPPQPIY